jgi:hypothetical protein
VGTIEAAAFGGYLLKLNEVVSDVGNTTEMALGPLANLSHTWTVAAYDALGNTSGYTDTWTFRVDKTLAIDPGEPVSGTFQNPGGTATTVVVPPGAVTLSGTLELKYQPVETNTLPTLPSTGTHVVAFEMELLQNGVAQPGIVFSQPITIAIEYDPALVTNVDDLELYYLDAAGQWSNDGITIIEPRGNPLIATIAHLTKFTMAEVPRPDDFYIYLPVVIRN